jgi:hypothetical protein
MKESVSVVALDLGINFGVCFYDRIEENSFHDQLPKDDRLDYFYHTISKLYDLYTPTAFAYGKPNLFGKCRYNVVALHFKLAGVLELFCERKQIYCFPINDSEARKIVFGQQITKKEAHKQIGKESADETDAIVISRAIYKKITDANE